MRYAPQRRGAVHIAATDTHEYTHSGTAAMAEQACPAVLQRQPRARGTAYGADDRWGGGGTGPAARGRGGGLRTARGADYGHLRCLLWTVRHPPDDRAA